MSVLHKSTDMQNQHACVHLLINRKYLDALQQDGHLTDHAVASTVGLNFLGYNMRHLKLTNRIIQD